MDVSIDERDLSSGSDDHLRNKKRERDKHMECGENSGLKKARFAWQVKGGKTSAADEKRSKVEEAGLNLDINSEHDVLQDGSLQPGNLTYASSVNMADAGFNHFQATEEKDTLEKSVTGKTSEESSEGDREQGEEGILASRIRNSGITSASFNLFQAAVNIVASPTFQWQKQELGCAIVDNVFNRTLEEIGISPDQKVNRMANLITGTRSLENQGIESAILQQGLTSGPSRNSQRAENVDTNSNDTVMLNDGNIKCNEAALENATFAYNDKTTGTAKSDLHTAVSSDTVNISNSEANLSNPCSVEEISQPLKMECTSGENEHTSSYNLTHTEVCEDDNGETDIRSELVDSDSNHMLDLAVSTAILTQGLTVKMN